MSSRAAKKRALRDLRLSQALETLENTMASREKALRVIAVLEARIDEFRSQLRDRAALPSKGSLSRAPRKTREFSQSVEAFSKKLTNEEKILINSLSDRRTLYEFGETVSNAANVIFLKLRDLALDSGFRFPSYLTEGEQLDVMRSAFQRFTSRRSLSMKSYKGLVSNLSGYIYEELVIRSPKILRLMNNSPDILEKLNKLNLSDFDKFPAHLRALQPKPKFTRMELLTDIVDGREKALSDFMIVAVDETHGLHWVVAIGECKLASVARKLYGREGQFANDVDRLVQRGFKYQRLQSVKTTRGHSVHVEPGGQINVSVKPSRILVGQAPELSEDLKTTLFAFMFLDKPLPSFVQSIRGLTVTQVTKQDLILQSSPRDLADMLLAAAGASPR
jgi:hypothetical protein